MPEQATNYGAKQEAAKMSEQRAPLRLVDTPPPLPGAETSAEVTAAVAAIDAQIAALTAQKEKILLGNSEVEQEFFDRGEDPAAMDELAAKQISDKTFK